MLFYMPMDDDFKKLLEKNLEVSQESLKILTKMRRAALVGRVFSFLKWVIIIGVSVGSYYYFEPYIKKMTDMFGIISSDTGVSPDLLKQIQNIFPPK